MYILLLQFKNLTSSSWEDANSGSFFSSFVNSLSWNKNIYLLTEISLEIHAFVGRDFTQSNRLTINQKLIFFFFRTDKLKGWTFSQKVKQLWYGALTVVPVLLLHDYYYYTITRSMLYLYQFPFAIATYFSVIEKLRLYIKIAKWVIYNMNETNHLWNK